MVDFDEIARKTGLNITNLISARGSTQTEIATLLGIAKSSVSQWAKGSHLPNIENLLSLADLFNITVSELLGESKSDNFENTYKVFKHDDKPKIDKQEIEAMQLLNGRGIVSNETYYNYLSEKLKEIAE